MTEDREKLGGGEGSDTGLDGQSIPDNANSIIGSVRVSQEDKNLAEYKAKKHPISSMMAGGLDVTLRSIGFGLNADRRNFNVGPVYKIKTSRGVHLNVLVTSANYQNRKALIPVEDGPVCFYRLLALDDIGDIVGIERLELVTKDMVDAKIVAADSATEVWPTGFGIGSAMSLVFTDVLQRYADKVQLAVNLCFRNANSSQLNAMRESYADRLVAMSQLQAAEAEQERWQSVWGDGGRYGFKNNSRIFTPDQAKAGVKMETIEFIELQRIETEKDGKSFVTSAATLSVVPEDQVATLKRRRQAELHTILEKYRWVHYACADRV